MEQGTVVFFATVFGYILAIVVLLIFNCISNRKKKSEKNQRLDVEFDYQLVCADSVEEDSCSICLAALKGCRNVVRTTCNHYLHKACLDRWLFLSREKGKGTCCPKCRTVIKCRVQDQTNSNNAFGVTANISNVDTELDASRNELSIPVGRPS